MVKLFFTTNELTLKSNQGSRKIKITVLRYDSIHYAKDWCLWTSLTLEMIAHAGSIKLRQTSASSTLKNKLKWMRKWSWAEGTHHIHDMASLQNVIIGTSALRSKKKIEGDFLILVRLFLVYSRNIQLNVVYLVDLARIIESSVKIEWIINKSFRLIRV